MKRFNLRYFFYQFHAVYRTQQGRQRERSAKTLRSPLSAKFSLRVEWQNLMQPFASTTQPRKGNINFNKYFISRVGIELTTSRFYSHTLCHCAMIGI